MKTPISRRTAVLVICLVAGGLLIFGCGRSFQQYRTMNGKLRIVSLAPSVTEILFELDWEIPWLVRRIIATIHQRRRILSGLADLAHRTSKCCWL